MKPFPTSAACCFGILFISVSLITTGSSEVQVVGSADRVVALAGDDVILPCSLKPSVSAKDMVVKWTGLFLETRNVHLYLDGRDSNEDQFPSYRRRTSLFIDELKSGNVSLKLTRVTLSDAGSYRCFIPTLTSQVKETTVQLIVGAASQPVISIDGTEGWGVVLNCESGRWYPEPEMDWLDSSGTILPADGPPKKHWDKEGLYTVRQHVTVDQTDTNRFTCRVQQQEINHTKETEIHVPDLRFPKSQLIVGLISAAFGVLAASAGGYMLIKHIKENNFKKREVMRDARFVDTNRFYLIHNVTMVIPIAFYLIRFEKYSEIHAAGTRQDQMELLYEALDSGGEKLKSDFYRILLDLEPDIVKDLGVIFVDILKDHLIQKVTKVKPIICELLDEKYFNFRINQLTSQDQMTKLYITLEEADITQKFEFYRILLDLEPYLVSELDSEDLYLYVLIQNLSRRIVREKDIDSNLYVLIQNLSRRIEVVIKQRGPSTDSDEDYLYLFELHNMAGQLEVVIKQRGPSTESDEDYLYLIELHNVAGQLEVVIKQRGPSSESDEDYLYLYELHNMAGQLEEVRKQKDSDEDYLYLFELHNVAEQLEEVIKQKDSDEDYLYLYVLIQHLVEQLRLRKENDSDEDYLNDLIQNLSRRIGDARFVDMNRFHLIHNVTMVIPIAFYLIRSEKYSEIHAARTRLDQIELLYEALDSGGKKLRSDFYWILLDLEPDVVLDLEKLRRLKAELSMLNAPPRMQNAELSMLNDPVRRLMGDARFVDMNRFHLIQNVTMVIPIAFYLIRSEKYSKIHAAGTREDQMELLYEALDSGREKLKSDFYWILLDLQPDLVKRLDPVRRLMAELSMLNAPPRMQNAPPRKQNAPPRMQNDPVRRLMDPVRRLMDPVRRLMAHLRRRNARAIRERDERIQNLSGRLDEVTRERDELRKWTLQLDEVTRERDELRKRTRQLDQAIREREESERIEEMEMETLLDPGQQKDDLDEMERGGRV